MYVYPSLPRHVASELYEEIKDAPLQTLRKEASPHHPAAVFYSTGARAGEAKILELVSRIRDYVEDLGFPEPKRTRDAYAAFDHNVPQILLETMDIVPGDAGDEGVWSFLSLVAMPDIASWRYPGRARERLLGLPRNTFRRLWWRGFVLGCGEGSPTHELGEDQLVAIMERPTIGGDPRLASAFSKAVMNTLADQPHLPSMFLMRESAKRLTRLTPFVCFGILTGDDLASVMREIVENASQSLSTA